MRKPKEIALGPQYRGSRISRDEILNNQDEDEDDPFAKGFGEDDSEAGDAGNGLEEESEDDGSGGSDTDATDVSEAQMGVLPVAPVDEDDRKALQKQMRSVASVSAAAEMDVRRGRAIKKQRAAFDALLNVRIKMQKSLIAANTIVAFESPESAGADSEIGSAISSAENALLTLMSSITSLRDEMTAARSGDKRKRSTITQNTPTAQLLTGMQEQEAEAIPRRKAVLQKWSSKIKANAPKVDSQKIRLNNAVHEATIIDHLNEELSAPDRLLKRARTPRSCAPVQSAQRILEDPAIYDDADWYGLLLKTLLDSKTGAESTTAASIDVGSFSAVRKEAKTKRNVDVKASKGRKLKYTVHEKLQNFMAPEELGKWGEKQTDELFGSLFGRRLVLDEADGVGLTPDDGVLDADASALLFGR